MPRRAEVARGHFRMARHKNEKHISRRTFLRGMRWAPVLFVPAPMRGFPFAGKFAAPPRAIPSFPFADYRLTPHYPAKSPLDDILRLVAPGSDEFVSEKYAFEIARLFENWSQALRAKPPGVLVLAPFLDASLEATPLAQVQNAALRSGGGIEVLRRRFNANPVTGRDLFLGEVEKYLGAFDRIETAQFELVSTKEVASSPVTVDAEIRYDIVGTRNDRAREERIGQWSTKWTRNSS